jgi:hypothetical protein
MRLALALLPVVLLGTGPASVAAQTAPDAREEILAYDVTIDVEADGWLEVTERIRVRALGDQIRRGIYRDVPTSFPREAGAGRITAPFEVTSVLRDGAPEPYVLQSVGGPARRGGIRVRIGDPDVFLDPGEHTYAITYRTLRWIQFGDKQGSGEARDALYWNVTGNGWDFPIRSATATVRLPAELSADAVRLEGWTGPEGSTASALTSSFGAEAGLTDVPGEAARFRTTAPLGPREGLTIRVSFPQGVVAPPSDAQLAEWFMLDWRGWIEAGLVTAIVFLGYLLLWVLVGRDPPGRSITVRYEPPEEFTPASLGYVMERGHDGRQLTAAVVDLAVRGWITIERDEKRWTLTRTEAVPADGSSAAALPPEEIELLRTLFGTGGRGGGADEFGRAGRSVELIGLSDPTVRAAALAFRRRVAKGLEGVYFRLNRGWFAAGVVISVLGFALLAWRDRFSVEPHAWFLGFWLTFWTLGTGTLVYRVVQSWRSAWAGGVTAWMSAGGVSLFAIPFVGAHLFVSYLVWQAVPPNLFAAALALGAINILFYHLLEQPTLRGRRVMDEALGLRAFLTSTEEDRIDRLQPAEAPLQLFERFLPWAIALGVESEWAERFEDALAAESAEAARAGSGYTSMSAGARGGLGWYSGAAAGSLSGLTGALGSSFSSALSSSSAAPSSSGGSGGGGGSSGGGGGGGGGGGW